MNIHTEPGKSPSRTFSNREQDIFKKALLWTKGSNVTLLFHLRVQCLSLPKAETMQYPMMKIGSDWNIFAEYIESIKYRQFSVQ